VNAYRDVREHSVHDSEARIRKDLEGRDEVENLQKKEKRPPNMSTLGDSHKKSENRTRRTQKLQYAKPDSTKKAKIFSVWMARPYLPR
jgi:hypothetical protein